MPSPKTIFILCLCLSTLCDAWFFGSGEKEEPEAVKEQVKLEEKTAADPVKLAKMEETKERPEEQIAEETKKKQTESVSPPTEVPNESSPEPSRIIEDDVEATGSNTKDVKPYPHHGGHHSAHGGVGNSAEHDVEFDHKAILGSAEKAEEFHHLSPAEAKRRLWALAKKIDADGNGDVTEEELQKWISKSLKSLNEEDSLRRFKEHDVDQDGKVGWEEYLKSFYGYIPDAESLTTNFPEDAAHFIKVFREDESKFHDADVDTDGSLTEMEFRAFTHPEDFVHMHPNYIQRLVNETDLNGDGAIDLEEFLKHGDDGGYSESEAEEWKAIEADRFTRGLDLDSNSKLERQEIAVWAVPNITDVARDEATHLIYSADKNRDAVLSVDEILSEYELFVGSAVTDFGQHLDDEL